MAEPDACAHLVALLEGLASVERSPRRFLAALGRQAAGIRPGPAGLLDLGTGGRNVFRGRGFKGRFDDATDGQVRHFAGIAVATAILGPRLTRWTSVHVGRDQPSSADGELTEAAIEFATRILSRSLPVASAPGWVLDVVCAAGATKPPGGSKGPSAG